MMPGFINVDSDTFYSDIWSQIKNDVEIVESNWDATKKGVCTVILKWGYKDLIKEKIVVAICKVDITGEKHWVDPTLIQRV